MIEIEPIKMPNVKKIGYTISTNELSMKQTDTHIYFHVILYIELKIICICIYIHVCLRVYVHQIKDIYVAPSSNKNMTDQYFQPLHYSPMEDNQSKCVNHK